MTVSQAMCDPGELGLVGAEFVSPYRKGTHVDWAARCRRFVEAEVAPYVDDWERCRECPPELWRRAYAAGLLPAAVGPACRGFDFVEAVAPCDFDTFHELVLLDEICRCGSAGVAWALLGCILWSVPPVINGAEPALRDRVTRDCLTGAKRIALMVTEPTAGSDVASIQATARPDGKGGFLVSGQKKWITGGIWADYFVVAARTGAGGMGGISMLLLEKSFEGISCRRMEVQGLAPSGTTFVELDDVLVPRSHLLGVENQGFKMVMVNFTHERWAFAAMAHRFTRVLLDESFSYAQRRSTFGKKLMEHSVIRWKLAEMTRQAEGLGHWLENVTYQMGRPGLDVTAQISLIKVHASKTFEYAAREASQIFGGNAYTKTGLGRVVERLYRDVRAFAIPGGSEEILLDLGVRQILKAAGLSKAKL
eukprot:TRINITY_DN15497_c0_g1_i1.p1 TRINITY_DN15497_c0_g1~~TRINITY_DN15497_c0_g1_i1.p1  ORF type:complete len:422 (-),score=61.57 TRINITY_DN15497_c0_g1_i1:155-1420(-)